MYFIIISTLPQFLIHHPSNLPPITTFRRNWIYSSWNRKDFLGSLVWWMIYYASEPLINDPTPLFPFLCRSIPAIAQVGQTTDELRGVLFPETFNISGFVDSMIPDFFWLPPSFWRRALSNWNVFGWRCSGSMERSWRSEGLIQEIHDILSYITSCTNWLIKGIRFLELCNTEVRPGIIWNMWNCFEICWFS